MIKIHKNKNISDSTHIIVLKNAYGDMIMLAKERNGNYQQNAMYEYDAFGIERYQNYQDTNPMRYCSQYYDTETGDYYLRARY